MARRLWWFFKVTATSLLTLIGVVVGVVGVVVGIALVQREQVPDRSVQVFLSKNPAGLNEVLRTITADGARLSRDWQISFERTDSFPAASIAATR